MKDILNYIITNLVEDKKEVEIIESEENGVLNLVIKVGKEDVGKIIGKGGKVIRSIRSVMKIPAIKQNQKVYISIAESE